MGEEPATTGDAAAPVSPSAAYEVLRKILDDAGVYLMPSDRDLAPPDRSNDPDPDDDGY